jgi:hypothetical protein
MKSGRGIVAIFGELVMGVRVMSGVEGEGEGGGRK